MSCSDILNALDLLVAYPALQAYVKDFDSPGGFMFTVEKDQHRRQCEATLYQVLDPSSKHSGSSWGFMLRGVQAVLNGVLTREYVEAQLARERSRMQEYSATFADWLTAEVEAEVEAEEKINCYIINIIKNIK